ncbi:D-xylose ABC transporter ATP-binding protein [Clostridium sp. W14A]|nr:D-xylose ABC transporter ATP-binding protein [Clostridium sp. W14A]
MGEYLVEMDHICKSFPGVKALDDVSFRLKSGEVLALLGENGAGKSTLMNVLSGVYQKDEGEIRLFSKTVEDLNPKKAQELGVAIIHQEMNLCRHLSVAENIFLGREESRCGVLQRKDMNRRAAEILARLNLDIDPAEAVGNLAVSKQQMVEIAKALSTDARVLIMDEPTSALTMSEIDELFQIIRRLKGDGCGIVYISHRLEELQNIADRVQIMRDGRYIASMNFADTTMDEIIANMVGREITEKFPRISCPRGEKILEVRNLNAGKMVRDINFDLFAGEIVGIAGLLGAGRTETTRAIFGADPKDSGQILLDGREVVIRRPIDAIRGGIMLVPEDRRKDGLCIKLSVQSNISLPNLDMLSNRFGVIDRKKEKKLSEKSIQDLNIKLPSSTVNVATLSGGNQQKVVVAKWLARNSRVVMFDEPTRGIDVAAKVEIYNLMNELKKQGIGVLFVSSEMPEILGISDRILVMCDGKITGEMEIGEASQDLILKYATTFDTKSGLPEAI